MQTKRRHRDATIFVAIVIAVTALMLIFKCYLPPFL